MFRTLNIIPLQHPIQLGVGRSSSRLISTCALYLRSSSHGGPQSGKPPGVSVLLSYHCAVAALYFEATLIPISNSTNLIIILGMMQVSKKIPFDDPQVLLGVRVLYVVSNLIILGIYLYMQMKINAKKGSDAPLRTTLTCADR